MRDFRTLSLVLILKFTSSTVMLFYLSSILISTAILIFRKRIVQLVELDERKDVIDIVIVPGCFVLIHFAVHQLLFLASPYFSKESAITAIIGWIYTFAILRMTRSRNDLTTTGTQTH